MQTLHNSLIKCLAAGRPTRPAAPACPPQLRPSRMAQPRAARRQQATTTCQVGGCISSDGREGPGGGW